MPDPQPAAPAASPQGAAPTAGAPPVVALIGNPNTGKSTLFNALSGLRQRVGNYPGVTVESKHGRMSAPAGSAVPGGVIGLIDLPGTYSLAPRSPDEMLAVDVLLGRQAGEPRPDAVLAIVDASNLERNLYLVSQVAEMGVPVVVALNMTDVAESRGLVIDVPALSAGLGLPVVPLQANRGRGLDDLRAALALAVTAGKAPMGGAGFPAAFGEEVAGLSAALRDGDGKSLPEFLLRRLVLDVGGHTERAVQAAVPSADVAKLVGDARTRLAAAGAAVPAVEARVRYAWIRRITAGALRRPAVRPVTWTDRLDSVLTHRLWGTVVFLGVMVVLFQAIFSWAGPLMDLIDGGMGKLADQVGQAVPPGPLNSLLTKGIIGGVGSVVIFLPQILILFAFVAVLEDCGYMARAAFLMDRLMSRCGLSGKSFIPLLSSVACAIPGIMATRVIENRRDRLATILVAPLMSCSARLPVYILLIGTFVPRSDILSVGQVVLLNSHALTLLAMYLIGFVAAPLVAMVLKRTLLAGETPVFVMEMPNYQVPSPVTVLRRMGEAGWSFLKRAGTLILATMILIWAALYFPQGDAGDGRTFAEVITEKTGQIDELREGLPPEPAEGGTGPDGKPAEAPQLTPAQQVAKDRAAALEDEVNDLQARWTEQSLLGRAGKAVEPLVEPLGWDWRIGMAAIASFPAREVVVGTMGIIYGVGEVDAGEAAEQASEGKGLAGRLRDAKRPDGTPAFGLATALSIMVFFALCAQCVSTLAIMRRETNSWGWPAFAFGYMTGLAYLAALAVYQVGSRLGA